MTTTIGRISRFTEFAGKAMMMSNETYPSTTRQLFAKVAVAGVAMVVPVMAAVPAVAAPIPAPGVVQVDRPWGWHNDDAPVTPPAPSPPHGCDDCSDNGGTDSTETGDYSGGSDSGGTGIDNGDNAGSDSGVTGGGPEVANG